MSKVTDALLPEDFGKLFDTEVFEKWKQSMNKSEKTGFVVLALQVVGLAGIIFLEGLVGLICLFAALITGMILSLSKRKAVKRYQEELGITNAELKEALDIRRKKMK